MENTETPTFIALSVLLTHCKKKFVCPECESERNGGPLIENQMGHSCVQRIMCGYSSDDDDNNNNNNN